MINIDELNNNSKQKEKKQNLIYDEILKKCHHKIKKTSETTTSGFCFYIIPEYIYGFPLYNFKGCILYIFKTLTKNGFEVRYTHPIEKKNNGYRNIEEYKPTGNLIYNKTFNSLSNKLNILKN
jgi:hypothetical protein